MKNRKRVMLSIVLVFLVTTGIALAMAVKHLVSASTATTAEQEFREAFGSAPPNGSNQERLVTAQRESAFVSKQLKQFEDEKNSAYEEYVDLQKMSSDDARLYPQRQKELASERANYQTAEDHFENACWAAHFYKIPVLFSASCKENF